MKKNGFTLIELLAVIIILGILMIIAIPSVTKYISDSRKNAYIDTAKEIIAGARNLVNEGKLEMYDTTVAYYIPNTCIKVENGEKAKSPYGEFVDDRTYVVVTYDGQGYDYYWVSLDETGIGVKEPISIDKLDEDDIESDLKKADVKDNNGVGKEKVIIFNSSCTSSEKKDAFKDIICKRATVLHTATCSVSSSSQGCRNAGYARNSLISFGQLGTEGVLTPGDAFDCDVNADELYDPLTERFYFVTKTSDNNSIVTLIHSENLINGEIGTITDYFDYDTSNESWHGPRTAINHMPSKNQWKNKLLISAGIRSIVNENNTSTVNGITIDPVNYLDKAARMLTYQEMEDACGTDITVRYSLNNCNYFSENIGMYFAGTGSWGFWLETPYKSNNKVWGTNSNTCLVGLANAKQSYNTVRAVIDVYLKNIDY